MKRRWIAEDTPQTSAQSPEVIDIDSDSDDDDVHESITHTDLLDLCQ